MNINDKIQGKYLKKFGNVNINRLEEFDIDKLIFNQTSYVLTKSFLEKKITIIAALFFKRGILKVSIAEKDILLFSEEFYRSDHREYWNTICSWFPEASRMTFIPLSRKSAICCFEPNKIIKKIRLLNSIKKQLNFIDSKINRNFLSAQLMWMVLLKDELTQKLLIPPKVGMCFFDCGFMENICTMFLKKNGCITITNQHGQPVFRDMNIDRLVQGQILNFKSDYFIAKGEFTKEQFTRAGFNENCIKVFGVVPNKENEIKRTEKKCFGVFLDGPNFLFANETNKLLIEIANQISATTGYEYIVKAHPADKKGNYTNKLNNYGTEYDRFLPTKGALRKIDFGLFYASAIYLDLINAGVKAYQYNGADKYPIVKNEEDKFEDAQDLLRKLEYWNKKDNFNKQDYLSKTKEYYICGYDLEIKLKEFIASFI